MAGAIARRVPRDSAGEFIAFRGFFRRDPISTQGFWGLIRGDGEFSAQQSKPYRGCSNAPGAEPADDTSPPTPPKDSVSTRAVGCHSMQAAPLSSLISLAIILRMRLLTTARLMALAAACLGAGATVFTQNAANSDEWIYEGVRLAPTDFSPSITGDAGIADASAVRLFDGRVRVYVAGGPTGMRTAVSPDEGLTFATQVAPVLQVSGQRTPSGTSVYPSQPRAVKLEDDRIRLYFLSGSPGPEFIGSALCDREGTNCAIEDGARITAAAAGALHITAPAIVRLRDGLWHAYYSLTDAFEPFRIGSATSPDMLRWTVDDGVRIGAGAPFGTGSSTHPGAIATPDGSVVLFYYRGGPAVNGVLPGGVYYSVSSDGINFPEETRKLAFQTLDQEGNLSTSGSDPEPLVLPDGRIRLYTGQGFAPARQRMDPSFSRINSYLLPPAASFAAPVTTPTQRR